MDKRISKKVPKPIRPKRKKKPAPPSKTVQNPVKKGKNPDQKRGSDGKFVKK